MLTLSVPVVFLNSPNLNPYFSLNKFERIWLLIMPFGLRNAAQTFALHGLGTQWFRLCVWLCSWYLSLWPQCQTTPRRSSSTLSASVCPQPGHQPFQNVYLDRHKSIYWGTSSAPRVFAHTLLKLKQCAHSQSPLTTSIYTCFLD